LLWGKPGCRMHHRNDDASSLDVQSALSISIDLCVDEHWIAEVLGARPERSL
jgi:hypothetical protein